ncbi:pyrethroid hydrolase Ces2a [Anabrus simplex]|uniref:pyrethroid hydrolase Ces2a n=1 Tax=Anabrus simplex TaxID=316456 RepID=UPI0035A38973
MYSASSVVFVCLLLVSLCGAILRTGLSRQKRIVGGKEAAIPPEDDPVVFVYNNDQDARVYGKREKNYYAFLGIRFAEPPVGRLRFQRPQRLNLMGDINATRPGPPCIQPSSRGGVTGSEDCLYLNVFTPELPGDGEGLPVLVWIHGGGFRRGSANQYGVGPLVSKNLVVVTIQYRLGSLGFLSAAMRELPGNAGMFDMVLALDWVRDYIKYFGGNPLLVKTFGQGSGAASAILLCLSTITKGLLGGVLAFSGNALSTFAIDNDPLGTARDLAALNNCPVSPTIELVRCLQQLPAEKLIEADSGLQALRLKAQGLVAGLSGLLGVAPVVEGPDDDRGLPNFLTQSPVDILKLGGFPPIPLLTGITKDETSTAIRGSYKKEILKNIAHIPGYVDNVLGGLLKNTAFLIGNVTDTFLQMLATNYFSLLTVKDTEAAFDRLVEVTGDALFHLPAFQTAQWWSEKAPLYLYSFEHFSDKKGGPVFLEGLPLVEQGNTSGTTQNTGVGHGDDLPYIFDAQPLDGAKDENIFSLEDPQDFNVQGQVTDFIAEFARSGVPTFTSQGQKMLWPSFSRASNNFLQVKGEPEVSNDFRSCQMSLWTGALAATGLHAVMCKTVETLVPITTGVVGLAPLSGVWAKTDNTASRATGLLQPPKIVKPPFGNLVGFSG